MFNEKGVFLVLTQIIISILSLNYKMDNELNNVGKSEAIRASTSYLIACTAKEALARTISSTSFRIEHARAKYTSES